MTNNTLRFWRPILSKPEIEIRTKMLKGAREGDKNSQEWLYKFHGMVGLWDKEKGEV